MFMTDSFIFMIDLNEKIIVEREEDLVGLERSIAEVNEIFRDLGMLVNDQQYLLGEEKLLCSFVPSNFLKSR